MQSEAKKTVIVVHSVRFVRESIVQALTSSPVLSVSSSFSSLGDAMCSVNDLCSDLLVLDVSLNSSVAEIRKINTVCPSIAIVVWGISLSDEVIVNYAKLGVAGYVTCEESTADLIKATECAYRGEITNARIAGILNRYLHRKFDGSYRADSDKPSRPGNGASHSVGSKWLLTSRETQIVKLINDGMSNKEIAKALDLELSTVKNHVHSILSKYKVKGRTMAAAQYRSQSEQALQV